MAKRSAGILLFRWRQDGLEVLLGHHGGPFWSGKDLGAWTIFKGEPMGDEQPLVAARREFAEETGFQVPEGDLLALVPVIQAGGKAVLAWAVEGDLDPSAVRSNTIPLEWPSGSGNWRRYPEIDRAEWFPLDKARLWINKGQIPLLDDLSRKLGQEEDGE